MSTPALELYYEGKLKEAIAAITDQVRRSPTDNTARTFLSELLMFAGDLERADRQMEALSTQDPAAAVHVAHVRLLLRAEQARQKFFTDGAVPDFLEPPGERLQLILKASIALREKNTDEAVKLFAEADALFPALTGQCNDQPFTGIYDIDTLTRSLVEVLAPNGKYYWIPMESIKAIHFNPPQRARDVLWRRGRLVLRSGTDSDVCFPAVYAGSHLESDPRLALGQSTEWREGPPVRGVGQRTWLVGDTDLPYLEIKTLTFEG